MSPSFGTLAKDSNSLGFGVSCVRWGSESCDGLPVMYCPTGSKSRVWAWGLGLSVGLLGPLGHLRRCFSDFRLIFGVMHLGPLHMLPRQSRDASHLQRKRRDPPSQASLSTLTGHDALCSCPSALKSDIRSWTGRPCRPAQRGTP